MIDALLNPAFLGLAMVITFMTLIMTRRMSAIAALLAVPITFGLIAGAGPGLGKMILEGVHQVAPTALLLAFAILYFAIMMDAGLFDPLVRRVLAAVGDDPVRIALGTALLTMTVSLDGDGTTTALIVITAFLPVYRRVGMNPLVLATLLGLGNALMNYIPWGGPTARAASAVGAELGTVFNPLVPAMLVGLGVVFVLAWHFGRRERHRLAAQPRPDGRAATAPPDVLAADPSVRRPRLFWVNLALTAGLVVGMAVHLAPLPVMMMGAFAIAATVNYPRPRDQKARIAAHADNVVNVVVLIFAAGAFTGILNGTGMADAMASAALAHLPRDLGPHLAPLTALASLPLTFVMSNDAYYFGVVPVVARAAGEFGISADAIARASLVGQPVHALSPLLAPIYLACGLLGVDVGDAQRFALKWALLICGVVLATALATGAIPLTAG
ncbi:citrate:proton symporter [Nitrospirillum sp. BR 11163]|uniref:CitMHS family transporter n=1 Tax=Nitrospirillum sp. BR 11163 TaxID=3104323 RepID=UPI002AFE336A|nr:citrate:proton symporter [Nitrospirillum sp. BR 11163]MEA1676297.1 citrate:proton symporter [Nitrospirillum sp. BR 11163]